MPNLDGAEAIAQAQPALARPALNVSHISKRFGGVVALREASFSVQQGRVLTLIGENGAGKSTLINIISGAFPPDTGSVEFDGGPLSLGNTRQALRRGIVTVHQELTLFSHQTVWENIFAGHELVSRLSRQLDRQKMIKESSKLFDMLNAHIDPMVLVEQLSLADQQMVEIAKALSWSPRLLILDEATSALDDQQVQSLFRVVRNLKTQGATIIFVSHRMQEVFTISDQAIVLKDGELVATFETLEGVTEAQLIEKMVGRSLSAIFPPKAATLDGPTVLQVQDLHGALLNGVSLDVHAGEIVGLGGLQGHGQAELLQILFGAGPYRSGKAFVRERQLTLNKPIGAIEAGVAYVPPDRKTEGLFLEHPVEFNLTITLLHRMLSSALGMIRQKKEESVIQGLRQRLRIAQRQWQQPVESLSGGNQQKVVLGKWLDMAFDLLLLDEPTRGIDVGTKGEIYRLLRNLAQQGKAVFIASTDSLELLGLCDRVYVLYEGKIQRELHGESLTEYELTHATMGISEPGGSI
jgi:ABC-type sugar transport system ATPase subunit